MTSRKMSFFEFWRSKKERGALLEAANQLRLRPSQQRRLLGDSGVRAALQNTRMASLLPPVGRDVFRRFTQGHEDEEMRGSRKKNKEVLEKDGLKPASELEAGKPLPFFYGDPPPKLLNTPLEELDPYYQSQETFITLSKGNIIHRFNAEPACYLLSVSSPLRTAAIKILNHSLFSLFIIVTILINCVFMTMHDPPAWIKTAEYVFIAIYTFETLIKVMGRGFCVGKFTFLRDPWNWLDVVVIGTAYLAEFVHFGKLSVLSTVPRVLKLIPLTSGLRMTVGALVQSVKRLAGIIVLMVFVLSVFAVVSMQLFMGSLRQKCIMALWTWSTPTFGSDTTPDYDDSGNEATAFDFREFIMNETNHYYLPGQLDALLCGNSSDAGVCPEGFRCIRGGGNPTYGYTNYDSFGWSLLTMFRLMTQDFWENLVMLTLRAKGKSYLIFFMLVVFPGCFCLLSLFLAVVTMTSSEWEEPSIAEAKRNQEEFRQIVQALKTREEEEQAAGRADVSEKQDGETKTSHEEEHAEESGDDRRSCPPCCSILADLFLKWNCCGCWRWLKQWLNAFVMNPFFDLGIVICLIINIIFIAMVHYPMSVDFEMHLSVAHLVFTAIFTAEMVLKLVAMDPYGYFQVSWHIFDSIIVFLALLELAVADVEGLSVLLRVFRLARWWPSFHTYLKIIWSSLRALKNLILLLIIMVFIFTMSGMQLFQKDYKDCVCRIAQDCELPRWHMNDFFNTFLLIARIFSGQWIETLWDCMEVSGQATCLIFFMMVVVIVNLLMLNLFLTLLLASFNSDNLVGPEEKRKNNMHIAVSRVHRAVKTWILDHSCTLQGKKKNVNLDHAAVDSQEEDRKDNLALSSLTAEQRVPIASAETDFEVKMPENEEKEKKCDGVQKHLDVQQDADSKDHKGNTPEDCCGDKCYRCCPFLDIDTSQGGGRVWSNFRRSCFFIVRNKYFELFIIFIILLSSLALVFEDIHLPQHQVLKMVVETADQVFTYLFLLEMLLKWIGYGLKKYFTDAWCWLDFLILDVFLVCLMANMFGFSQWGAIQSLRTLRALGPLRALSRFQGSRVVVEVLVFSIPFMIDAVLVLNVIWLFFSIAGVDLFAGKFEYCFNETAEEYFLADAVDNKSDCIALIMMNMTEVRWKNVKLNYDNVLNGFQSLMHLAASADLMDLRYAAADSRQVESQPVYEANQYTSLYFIFFSISSFFSLNFLIRAIINSLQRDKFGGKYVFMTEEQQKFSKAAKTKFFRRPQTPVPRPQSLCRARLFDLLTSVYFEVFMVVLICLNMVPLIVETNDDSWKKEEILYWFRFLFINIFIIEFILKITAFGWRYFTDGWNIFDFLLVICSIISVFFADIIERYMFTSALWPTLRLVRIVRILHLSCARDIRKLLVAFMMSLPALFNICLVFLVIMFTFSILGMFNFPYVTKGAGIDDMYNFETFWSSLTCMFMTSTSTGWFGFLLPIMNTPPDCDPWMEHPGLTVRGDCGNEPTGTIFFTTYVILTFVLVLHLYIVVVLQAFSSEDIEVLCDDDLRRFYKTWRKFDPEDSQFIQYSKLSDFCDALRHPLRIPKPNTIKLIHMDLPLFPGDKIHCVDVFATLATQVLDDSEELGTLKARMEEVVTANSPKVSNEPISSTLQRKQEEVAAKVIQRAYRKHLQHGDTEETAVQSGDSGGGALV
ncbi:sodium channel protein type 4 subunit alpha B-like [Chaetodon trifascialis]|uniref:sodium channel protein type 4 subunit alpha B-like n=1 Tax=Chaetodon trifascialis TaxID=109706 RepID=UPI003993E50E